MSNTRRLRRPRPQNPASALLAALDGTRVRGGCDNCDAWQTVRAHGDGPDFHRVTVHHDDWCPWWAARRETR